MPDSPTPATDALSAALPLVYDEMRKIAASYLRRERRGHTLQPTALVSEAYLRLSQESRFTWQDRAQLLGVAARSMRQILVDHARRRGSLKRGGKALRVTLSDQTAPASFDEGLDLLALDAALTRLATLDTRKASVVELRLLAGLSEPEIARALSVSERTVRNDWAFARAWLEGRLA